MKLDNYYKLSPFSLENNEKNNYLKKFLNELTFHHKKNSKRYNNFLKLYFFQKRFKKISDIPFLPAKIFKDLDLFSVSKNKIFKVLKSSGTSSSNISKIFLDKDNAERQIRILKKIVEEVLGKTRMPMLIIDSNPRLQDRRSFNARKAAIYGFSIFGKDQTFLLNEKNEIDYEILNNFLRKYGKNKFFVFGFTSFVYENLFKKLLVNKLDTNFKNGILIHGGGWKKMENIKVNKTTFKKNLEIKLKLKNIFNYYGMIEQTGSIFIECKYTNSFVTSIFSDVIIRDKNFNVLEENKKGIVQLLSVLPTSYPGHSILTEDEGKIINVKNCKCGLKGKHFLLYGRLKDSEVRGCSDI
tara:strand:- start:25893 stop:26954 length:1062 start_codon:yes stop_codon:yes gene_type:complete